MVAVYWEDNPEDLLQRLNEDETVNAIPPMVDEFKPGLTIRVMINGEPMTVIPTNAVQGEDQSLEAFTRMNRAEDILVKHFASPQGAGPRRLLSQQNEDKSLHGDRLRRDRYPGVARHPNPPETPDSDGIPRTQPLSAR